MSAAAKILHAQVGQFRAQLQRGESLAIADQRAIVELVEHERKQGEGNLNRLVRAREAYDRLCKLRETDVSRLSTEFLTMLVAVGVELGHGEEA